MEAVIKNAITQEELSHEFYLRLADLVSHADTKETLRYLAREELEHKQFLEGCITPEGCKLTGRPKEVHLAEHAGGPQLPRHPVSQRGPGGGYEAGRRLAALL